ncbi:MAG: bifunctional diaminohydroxyphosphoribosylaminopyrimidine deaminase/5-amino-6-(5-phosphoribosylamino)uracil reductase RibD [bacterium]|nr:MAG: bifunctional diaminohydroxyphosphoribosylaminopyrimidine deaminase/5-amino-6-(5-phosphoribosylamino)uracil reductase RibD [bacterium]
MAKDWDDKPFMQRALRLAAKGRGTTHPNPMVGAVLVKDGRVIGEGWHREPGAPHAEIHAIRNASTSTVGACLYVNLEPCSHQGRTPPCTEAIIRAGVERVVASCRDPNPSVDGRGFQALRDAGISVSVGLGEDRARELNRAFLHYALKGTPYVVLKLASTIDGRIATSSGQSRWITGAPARKAAHRLRADADGVLVGAGTVAADDPSLTVRHLPARVQPRRIVLDKDLRTAIGARLVEQAEDGRTLFVIGPGVDRSRLMPFEAKGVKFLRLPAGAGGFVWGDLAKALADEGMIHLLVEGGGQTAAFFVRSGAVSRVELFLASRFIGEEGIAAVGALGVEELSRAPELRFVRTRRIGDDIRLTADVLPETVR